MAKILHRNNFSVVHGFSLLYAGACCLSVLSPPVPTGARPGRELGSAPRPLQAPRAAGSLVRPRTPNSARLCAGCTAQRLLSGWLQVFPMGIGTKGLLLVPATPRQSRAIQRAALSLGLWHLPPLHNFGVPACPRWGRAAGSGTCQNLNLREFTALKEDQDGQTCQFL